MVPLILNSNAASKQHAVIN